MTHFSAVFPYINNSVFWGVEDVAPYCFITKLTERNGKLKKTKKKRKANGNLTRRPPARLIALYKVFKVSLKPFQRLAECEAEPHKNSLVGFGATPREKGLAGCGAAAPRKQSNEESEKTRGKLRRGHIV